MSYSFRSAEDNGKDTVEKEWGSITWLANQAIGNATELTLGRVRIKFGCTCPRHCHTNCEEVIYVLKGTLEHTVGGETLRLSQGDTLTIPAGVYHGASAVGDLDSEMIVAYPEGTRDYTAEEADA
ncbi:cupin domain-containing protein [candidate division KSB1 bacterium]|nr:cupin domain-containing protein [candidate division KSB1 bacterium]